MTEQRVDPALLRGLSGRRIDRRDIFKIAGLGAAVSAAAACGVKGAATGSASQAPNQVEKFWAGKSAGSSISFANWPLYMDPSHPELKKFTAQTGVPVTYKEVINDDPTWFAKIQPQLAAKQSIGYDLMVITNGVEFQECIELGFYAPLDHSKMPNYTANAAPKYTTEAYDKGNVYSVPWTSGITGIGYNPKYVKNAPTSMKDLADLAYKGKVGMFSDTQELANFGLLAAGIDPGKSTKADWQKAADKLKQQKDAGIVRKYYDQSYVDALGSGEVWITQAWSGDILQKNASDGTNFQFVIPQEGGTIWTDNFAIPITAKSPLDAISMIDFFYKVDIAASLAEYINYVCPVPAAQAQIKADAAKLSGDDKTAMEAIADSPLVFPQAADYAKLHYYREFKTVAEQQAFQKVFEPIVLG